MLGILICFAFMMLSIISIVALSVFSPLNEGEGYDFMYCYSFSLLYTLVLGEFLAAILKAWFVWLAGSPKVNIKAKPFSDMARALLMYFPCLLPIDV